jgi:hypothetical protein
MNDDNNKMTTDDDTNDDNTIPDNQPVSKLTHPKDNPVSKLKSGLTTKSEAFTMETLYVPAFMLFDQRMTKKKVQLCE